MATNKLVASDIQSRSPGKNDYTSAHAPGKFARHPIIGWLMFIFGGLAFGALLYNLKAQGPLLPLDNALATILPAFGLQHTAILKPIMDSGYYIGGAGIIILTLIFSIYFIVKRHWEELVMLLIGSAGSTAVWYTVSNLVGRLRPPTQIWIILKIPGFPSGHTLSAVAVFGLLAYLLVPKIRSAFGKVFVVALAILIMLFIGFTRVFTAAHYLTDVLSGFALGIAWSGVAYTLIETYYQKRRSRNVKKG